MLKAEHITVRYGSRTVVDDLSFSLEEGQWLMLAGPNGAGKSTLISALSGGAPHTGRFLLGGRDAASLRPHEMARKIGVLAQRHSVGYAFTVEEVVSLGRYAHATGFLSGGDREGQARVEAALELTGLSHLRHASMLTLSGGEMQRAFLAQVFAQEPQILILDEPANHLDLVYQKHVFELIGEWIRTPGRAVMSVVHDLSLARRYGTHALLMSEGRCIAQGRTNDVLTRENLSLVYEMDVHAWMRAMLAQWQEE